MIAEWKPVAGWMRLFGLDNVENVDEVYSVAWRFTDKSDDPWTARINSFKNGRSESIDGAIRTISTALGELMEAQQWEPSETGLSVALSSGDTKIVPSKPLPKCGKAVASQLGLTWLPDLLTKEAHKRLHNIPSASKRDQEVAGKYTSAKVQKLKRVIVIDDIVTRGSTQSEIARAIKDSDPDLQVIGIALGKSERQEFAKECGKELDNTHVPEAWTNSWDGN